MTDPTTLTELYFGAFDRFKNKPAAVRFRKDGTWRPISHLDLGTRIAAASAGIRSHGIRPGDRVAILSENRPEWAIVDFACLTAGAIDVPIYPTLLAKQIEYLLNDSGAKGVFVSSAAQLAKIQAIRPGAPALEWVAMLDSTGRPDGVLSLDEIERRGTALPGDPAIWRRQALEVRAGDLATIIYTSGTTGEPKGVMLTHGNITSNVVAGSSVLPLSDTDSCLSLLPLSHIFERMTGHYCMFHGGATISYAESIETVARDMIEERPTVVAAVPRLFEKIYAKALETAVHGSALTKAVFYWAKGVGDAWADLVLTGRPVPAGLRLKKRLADAVVFRKIQNRVGGRIRYFLSGGAPLSADIARFFYGAGLPILEGYGLTETSPVITVNTPKAFRLGTVGKAIPGVEMKIADDGEILARGPNVMTGYYHKPDDTQAALDPDGWFHTGDIGEIDADGFLKITDRKKDLIATAGGKKIAPQPIEGMLRQNRFIANAVLLGDRRKFPIALLAPNFANLEPWATAQGIHWGSPEELLANPLVVAHFEAEAKKHLRDLAKYEVPKRFLLVPREFSIETGELTPKLSVKRRVVEAHYQKEIDAIYQLAEDGEDGNTR